MWTDVWLALMLTVCVATDLKSRRIYNVIVFPSLLAAFIEHVWTNGWGGLWFSLGGFAVGLGILLIPYLMGGIGAGDVKLLAAIGAFKGAEFVVSTTLYMGLIGLGLALVQMVFRKEARERIRKFFVGFAYGTMAWRSGTKIGMPQGVTAAGVLLPYGVAISGGAALAYFWGGFWG